MARRSRDQARSRRDRHRAAALRERAVQGGRDQRGKQIGAAPSLIDEDSPTLQMAMALWDRRKYDQSLELYDRALREQPHNVRVLVNASRAFGGRYDIDRAQTLLDQLLRLGGHLPFIQFVAGQSYHLIHRPDQARACFERACAATNDLPQARLALAQAYERAHRLDEARQLIDSVVDINGAPPLAHLVRAKVLRRQGLPDLAEATLRKLVENDSIDPEVRCEAWADIASLFDAQGDYDGAMDAIGHCKRDQLSRDVAERKAADHVLGRFGHMIDTITAADFRRWESAPQPQPARRLALLAGFPRSGTTLLEQILDSHPQVVSSEERDIFAREIFPSLGQGHSIHTPVQHILDAATPQRIHAERTRYLRTMEQLLGEPIGDRLHVDKNPALTLMIPPVLRLFPEIKLVIALRDPRDVVLSCFLRYFPLNPVSVCLLKLEDTARRYALDMRGWLKYRDMIAAPWIEIRYEDMVADLPAQARRTTEFLGLEWDDRVLAYRERAAGKAVQSPTYADVTKPVYTSAIGRWRNYARYLEPVMDVLDPFVNAFGYARA